MEQWALPPGFLNGQHDGAELAIEGGIHRAEGGDGEERRRRETLTMGLSSTPNRRKRTARGRGAIQQQSAGDGGETSMASRPWSSSVQVEDARAKRHARGFRSRTQRGSAATGTAATWSSRTGHGRPLCLQKISENRRGKIDRERNWREFLAEFDDVLRDGKHQCKGRKAKGPRGRRKLTWARWPQRRRSGAANLTATMGRTSTALEEEDGRRDAPAGSLARPRKRGRRGDIPGSIPVGNTA